MYQIESGDKKTFQFAIDDDRYEVPTFESLPYKMLKEYRDYSRNPEVTGSDVAMWAIEHIFEQFAPGCTEKLTIGQLYGLVDAYTNVGELGE